MNYESFYDFVCHEKEDLDEKARRGEVTLTDVQYGDLLEHYKKSHLTNKAMEETGYSGRGYMPTYYGGMGGRSYADGNGMGGGNSYARGRSNARRDSMGRYSRGGYSYDDGMTDLLEQMRGMIHELPEEKRRKAQRLMDELEH